MRYRPEAVCRLKVCDSGRPIYLIGKDLAWQGIRVMARDARPRP